MKISAVDVFILKTPLRKPFAFSQGWVKHRAATLVKITADDGNSGWGEAFTQGLEPPEIAQPDVGSCRGIAALRDIVAIAHANGVAVNPHVWGSAVAQAASLQVIASLPTPHASLFANQPLLEYDCSDHPFRQQLISQPWSVKQGMITIPMGPGLGIDVQMDAVKQYRA